MDQDGNTVMPQKPDFSSPNSPENPQIAAAAAAMPESEPKQAIMSAPSAPSQARGMFSNRRFKADNSAAPTSFAGAPDFFNQAASNNSSDFITIGGDAPAPKSPNKKLFIIGGCLLAGLAIVLVISFVPGLLKKGKEAGEMKELQAAWHKMSCRIVYGEDSCEITTNENGYAGLTIPGKNVDYESCEEAIKEFVKTAEELKDAPEKDDYISMADNIRSNIEAMEVIDDFLDNGHATIAEAVESRKYNEESSDTIIYSSYSEQDEVKAAQMMINNYAKEKYETFNFYYSNGCNTSELLLDDDCGSELTLTGYVATHSNNANILIGQIRDKKVNLSREIAVTIHELNKERADK